MDTARVKLTGRRQFVGVDEGGRSVVMDARPEYKGDGAGIRPIELVLHAMAGCTGMDVLSVLEKKRQDVRGLEVIVSGQQREDEFPKIYTTMDVEYVVTGFGVRPEAVERAIELSEEKYCTVRGMLGSDVKITSSYRIVEAEQPGFAVLDKKEQ